MSLSGAALFCCAEAIFCDGSISCIFLTTVFSTNCGLPDAVAGITFTSINYPLTMPTSGGLPSYDAIIFKTNNIGNVTWAKQGAAIYDDRILKVDTDDQSNIYVCGQFSDTLTFSGTYNNNAFNARSNNSK